MVDKIQDLNLPNAVVARLIKEALPDGINVGKEARSAIARAASIFGNCSHFSNPSRYIRFFKTHSHLPIVLYLTSTTAVITKKQKHKTLSADNVLDALEEVEFENFVEPLRQELETFRRANKEKKGTKSNGVKATASTSVEHDDLNNDDMEE